MLCTFTEYKVVCCPEEPRYPIGWKCHVVPLWGYTSWASRPTTAEQTLWSSVQLQTMQGLLEERRADTSGIWQSGYWEWDGLRGVRSLLWTQCQDELSDQQGPEVKSKVLCLPLSDSWWRWVRNPSELSLSPPTVVHSSFGPNHFLLHFLSHCHVEKCNGAWKIVL